jgi:predicted metal-dependent enzyme (double-stranded beta helix superfamily)
VGGVGAQPDEHELGVAEPEQADRVAEAGLVVLLSGADVLHRPAVLPDHPGEVRVLLV